MSNELKKRIITSVFLFAILFLSISINKAIFTFTIFIVSAVCFHEWNDINIPYFFKKKKKVMLFIQLLGLVYLFIFFISSLAIYNSIGEFFLIFILFVCACSDIGGYIFGRSIGGKKLTKISPNKTIAGSIGSFILSLVPLLLLNFQSYFVLNFNLSLKNILFCLIISLCCQLGDLTISYIKRLNKIKNTGNILPGHGGLLDRIDGIIFALPVTYILKLLQIF